LDSDLDRVVTVVEWGSGLAEALNTDRLEIDIERERGDFHDDFDPESGLRTITLTGVGPRWAGVPLDTLDSALKDS
jgi:tRNA threonylcarbamoyladenosine biosynthesis protein TsaE